jgi:hypothetical protein
MTTPSLDPDQRARLVGAKLTALVDQHWGPPPSSLTGDREAVPFAGGAALLDEQHAWILIDDESPRGLGAALAWGDRHDRRHIVVLAGATAGELARQATCFDRSIEVFSIEGRTVVPAVPAAPVTEPDAPAVALAHVGDLEAAGLDVVVEHGAVTGEILGLEVARVAVARDGTSRVEVGVGRNDREAFAMLHGDLPASAALQAVVDAVRTHRRAGAPPHPLNRLAGERWLRAHLRDDPARLAAWRLRSVAGPKPRHSVNDQLPAFAVGIDDTGATVVVGCSVGIDLEFVAQAADARMMWAPDARLVLAVPARDAHTVTRTLATSLRAPAEVLPIEGDWRR